MKSLEGKENIHLSQICRSINKPTLKVKRDSLLNSTSTPKSSRKVWLYIGFKNADKHHSFQNTTQTACIYPDHFKEETNLPAKRPYESIISEDLRISKSSKIRRIKLSQLKNQVSVHLKGFSERFEQNFKLAKPINNVLKREKYVKRQRKIGYERQNIRLQQNEKILSNFLGNYENVSKSCNLNEVAKKLRQQAIKNHSSSKIILSSNNN